MPQLPPCGRPWLYLLLLRLLSKVLPVVDIPPGMYVQGFSRRCYPNHIVWCFLYLQRIGRFADFPPSFHSFILKTTYINITYIANTYTRGTTGVTKKHFKRRYILPTSSTNIFQHSFYFRSIRDWNASPPRLIDHDNIDQFTNEIQQIYKF